MTIAEIRCRISAAALFVKVRHKILAGSMPISLTRYAYLQVNAFVLPVPAPATTLIRPSVEVTASLWRVLSLLR